MRSLSTVILGINVLMMFAFAIVQWNDPDPLLWIAFYLLCAAVPLLVLLNKPMKWVAALALIACAIEMARTGSGAYNYYLHMNEEALMQSMNPDKPYIEEAREFLGALLAALLVALSQWLAKFRLKNR